MRTKEERMERILARGEFSGHCHVIIGEEIRIEKNSKGEILIKVNEGEAILKHILETPWVEDGEQIWTKEHKDIVLEKGTYKFIQQNEYNPYPQKSRSNSNFQPIKD